MRKMTLTAAAAMISCVGAAQADTFFVFQEETMYRFELGGPVSDFDLGRTLISSSFDDTGRLVGFEARSRTSNHIRPAYEVLGAFGGAPAVSQLDDGLDIAVSSLTYINGRAFGVDTDNNLHEFDATTLADMGIVGNLGFTSNGLGYDAVNDVLYSIDKNSDLLHTIDYTDASSSVIGSLGIDVENAGAEFFNGTLYSSVQNNATGMLEIGTIDTSTGAFTSLQTLASFPDPNLERLVLSMAVIPTPSSMMLLGLGGLVAAKRRR